MKRRAATGRSTGTDAEPRHEKRATLGGLLYADPSRSRAQEAEWTAAVAAIAGGDQAALRALFERAHRVTFTLIMRITRNRQTAEELTVDVFHDVWRRAAQYDAANGPVLGWILNQARSRAIDRLRHERRRKRVKPMTHELLEDLVASGYDETLDREALARKLRDAVSVLAPGERESIEAAFFSGMTYAEVAAELGQPLGTIKTRIRSGLGKLRAQLAPDEGEP
jgi:RNA polymerase sigma-70 factor, ECF subfamily